MTALQILSQLADQRKAERSPNFPTKYIPRSKYNDKDSNSLTRCIVDYLNLSSHFATRLQSIGTYREDIKKFVASQQRAGLPDVMAIVAGRAIFVEVKHSHSKDRLSEVQKETINALLLSGAYVFISKDFASFYDWFTNIRATLVQEEYLPFVPAPANQD